MRDLQRGRLDIPYFASRWLGIDLHPGQVAWAEACAERDETGWRPKYLTTVVSAGNRAGKTLVLSIVVLHHVFYKLGLRPPKAGDREDSLRWQRQPFGLAALSRAFVTRVQGQARAGAAGACDRTGWPDDHHLVLRQRSWHGCHPQSLARR